MLCLIFFLVKTKQHISIPYWFSPGYLESETLDIYMIKKCTIPKHIFKD